jgi:CBS domain-containing protein
LVRDRFVASTQSPAARVHTDWPAGKAGTSAQRIDTTQGECTMNAKDIMTTRVVTVSPETPVAEIARRLLQRRISAVPVIDAEGRPVGIVSEGDLMRRPEAAGVRHPSWWLALIAEPETQAREYVKAHGECAHDVMTRDVTTVTEEASLEEIATLLEKHRVKRVPVVRDGKVVGIVSRANLLQGVAARQPAPQASVGDRTLRERVTAAIQASGSRIEFVNPVVEDGVVHLWGMTYSEAEREAIQIATAGVSGVKRIESQLGVVSPMLRASWGAQ